MAKFVVSGEMQRMAPFCPGNPAWSASMLENVGPRGKLAPYLACPTVQAELKRRGHEVIIEEVEAEAVPETAELEV